MKQIFKGIMDEYATLTTLSNALTGGFHFKEAPQGTDYPFCVFDLPVATPDHHASGGSYIENTVIEFSIYDKDFPNLLTILDLLIAAWDNNLITIGDYFTKSFVRIQTLSDKDEDVFGFHVFYRLFLEPE